METEEDRKLRLRKEAERETEQAQERETLQREERDRAHRRTLTEELRNLEARRERTKRELGGLELESNHLNSIVKESYRVSTHDDARSLSTQEKGLQTLDFTRKGLLQKKDLLTSTIQQHERALETARTQEQNTRKARSQQAEAKQILTKTDEAVRTLTSELENLMVEVRTTESEMNELTRRIQKDQQKKNTLASKVSKTEKEKVEKSLAVGNSGLKFLLGMPQQEELILIDTLSEAGLKENILEEGYNYSDRKEMQLLGIAQKLGEFNIKRYQLGKIPTIAAFGSYSKNAQRNTFSFFDTYQDWFTTSIVGLKMAIPIFSGNSRNAHIQQSKYELQKTNNNIEQLKQSIDYDVAQSKIKMTSALLTVDNQKRNTELAEKVYNTTKKKYEQGLGNNQEIYNAQTELKVAQNNYYSSLYEAINAKIDWLKAAGKL